MFRSTCTTEFGGAVASRTQSLQDVLDGGTAERGGVYRLHGKRQTIGNDLIASPWRPRPRICGNLTIADDNITSELRRVCAGHLINSTIDFALNYLRGEATLNSFWTRSIGGAGGTSQRRAISSALAKIRFRDFLGFVGGHFLRSEQDRPRGGNLVQCRASRLRTAAAVQEVEAIFNRAQPAPDVMKHLLIATMRNSEAFNRCGEHPRQPPPLGNGVRVGGAGLPAAAVPAAAPPAWCQSASTPS